MGNFSSNFKRIQQIKNTNFERDSAQLYWKRELADMLIRTGQVTLQDIEEDNLKQDGEKFGEKDIL